MGILGTALNIGGMHFTAGAGAGGGGGAGAGGARMKSPRVIRCLQRCALLGAMGCHGATVSTPIFHTDRRNSSASAVATVGEARFASANARRTRSSGNSSARTSGAGTYRLATRK